MIKKFFLSSVLLMTITAASAQHLKAITETLDCGKVVYEKPVTAEFELQNGGSEAVQIIDVQTSCGCLGAEYPKEPVAPGAVVKMRLTYDSRMLGHFNKSALVYVKGADEPVMLTMKGVVLTELQDYSGEYPYTMGDLLADCNVLEFDDVNKGDSPEQIIYVYNNGTETVYPTLLHLPSYLTASASPMQLKAGQAGQITVRLESEKLRNYGLTQSNVYLGCRPGEKVKDEIELPVSVVLLPSFVGMTEAQKVYAPKLIVSDEVVEIDFEGKKRKTANVILTNKGRTTLNINSLQLFTNGVKVVLPKRSLEAGESTTLKLTAYREQLKKVKTKPRVLMITNDPDKSKVVIELKVLRF